jgi:hypothetical protein
MATRIGIGPDDVVRDWGLDRPGLERLHVAVRMLIRCGLVRGPGASRRLVRLQCVASEIEGARSIDPRAVATAKPFDWRLAARGVAGAFSLGLREEAALLELRWAAQAETAAELAGHLDQAALRIGEAIAGEQERLAGYAPTPGVVAALAREAGGNG